MSRIELFGNQNKDMIIIGTAKQSNDRQRINMNVLKNGPEVGGDHNESVHVSLFLGIKLCLVDFQAGL